ncbi:hypothetical protein TVAG_057180 [Trichomonas vaginalis G3]|uniref:P-type ATPase A domain-containing protein n=1 Tax=Trichomonas vaginalis (strain ATCC PRA-98 / G3) TaxID=412133 RepID=A2EKC6_TRIV3|nr:phospholipid-translocating ATPase protein [Trichomonas vaginalis G3]EAY06924.1 hypothetical protein TVAG_057180 [Trichomonas vaginalis G3]KAI5513911.1 phospholipid-translocating ATPase protein [Trichomonas vaginalis G3]|eukprot:XP_001319147.1 hypothetical protein [Trichomonas vaginalis G3]
MSSFITFSSQAGVKRYSFQKSDFCNKSKEFGRYLLPNAIYNCLNRPSTQFLFLVMILQFLFPYSIHVSVTIISLLFSFSTSIIIDVIRYYKNKQYKKRMTGRKVLVLENDQWISKSWSDLNIGDIIKLQNGDYAPADLIILNTADNQQCSIELYLIDGSPQWQPRTPINFTTDIKENPNFLLHSIRVEHYEEQFVPISEFNTKYNFFAKLDFNKITYDVNNTNFVERYSAFYHKGEIICGVVFTESDCLSNYSMHTQYKTSRFEKELNKLTTWQIYFLICFAFLITIFTDFYQSQFGIFSASDLQIFLLFADHFSYYIILLSPLISIQIFTVLDLIILLNSQIIQTHYERASIFSIDSLSESTNISSIITSKSMILERKPCLKRIFLNNTIYGTDITAKLLSRNIENDILQNKPLMKDFYDQNLVMSQDNVMFFHHISLCHSASIVGSKNNFNYISRFPDDEQLLKLAANSGYLLVGRTPNESKVLINDKTHTFKTKKIFHSCVRHPRISIIIEDENGNLILLSRGVYKVMLNTVKNIEQYSHVYDSFHENGLHVEVCSYKFLTQRELNNFEQKIDSLGEGNSEFEFAFIEALESQSTFISMLGFEDVPRDGCLLFLSRCKKAFNQIIISSQSKGTSLIITEISLGLLEKPIVGTIKGNIPEDVDISISYIMENSNYDVLIITGNAIVHIKFQR